MAESICPICTDEIDSLNDTMLSMPGCKHVMHANCFGEYIHHHISSGKRTDVTCPVCRGVMLPVDNHVVMINHGHVEDEEEYIRRNSHRVCLYMSGALVVLWVVLNFKLMFMK